MKISEQEKAKNRARILEAAVDVITEKVFKSASMREIAQRVGIGVATIYNYFSSKEKLIYGYLQRLKGLHHLADDFVFFDRTIYGLCKLFERMGARVLFAIIG